MSDTTDYTTDSWIDRATTDHIVARWAHLGRMGWQGSITWAQYLTRNRPHAARNLADGLVSDGRGFYLPTTGV